MHKHQKEKSNNVNNGDALRPFINKAYGNQSKQRYNGD